MRLPLTQNCPKYCMGKVSRIPTIGDYTIFFNSLFFVLYSESVHDPVIILGAARSGTKILRDTIAAHPSLVSIPYDISFVWKYGVYHIKHDELSPVDITKHDNVFIYNFFHSFYQN